MINLGELLLLHRVGDSVPCRNVKPMGVIDEYGDICVCCGSYTPEGRMICLGCEKGWNPKKGRGIANEQRRGENDRQNNG